MFVRLVASEKDVERTTSASPSLADSHNSVGNAKMLAAYALPLPRSSPFLSPSPAHAHPTQSVPSQFEKECQASGSVFGSRDSLQ